MKSCCQPLRACAAASILVLACASPALADLPTPITLGEVVAGEITDPAVVQTWVFEAEPGQTVFVERLASSNKDKLNWKLSDSLGRIIDRDVYQLGHLGPAALMGGKYNLAVFGEAGGTGTYELRVVVVEDVEHTAALGDTVAGELTLPGQRYRVLFDAVEGDRLFVDYLASSNYYYTRWTLTDPLGRHLQTETGDLFDAGPWTLTAGTHALTIFGEGAAVGSFEVRLATSAITSVPMALDTEQAAAIDSSGGRVVQPFTGAAGARVFFDVLDTDNYYYLGWELDDPEGNRLFGLTGDLRDVGPLILHEGEYTLTVRAEGAHTGGWTTKIWTIEDSEGVATIGDVLEGALTTPQQRHTYSFSATPGQRVFVDVTGSNNVWYLDYELLGPGGRALVPQTGDLSDRGPFTLAGGDYTLRIIGEGHHTGDWTVHLAEVVDGGSEVELGTPFAGEITGPGRVAHHTFSAAAKQIFTVDVKATSNQWGLNYRLRDTLGRDVIARTSDMADKGPLFLVGGDYTLSVLGEGDDTGTYSIELVDVGIANYTPVGTATAVGSVVAGKLTAGLPDEYTIALTEDTSLFLDLHTGAPGLRWTLFDVAGQVVFGPAQARYPNSEDRGPYPLVAGTYTLRLAHDQGQTPDYVFQTLVAQHETAGFGVGDTASGAFTVPGSTTTWSFEVPEGSKPLFLDLQDGGNELYWTLTDPVGEPVFSDVRARYTNDDRGPLALTPGVYALRLDPRYDTTPDYQFRLLEVVDAASPLAMDQVVEGTISGPGATTTYTITLTEPALAYLDLQTGASGLFWTLEGPDGQALFSKARAQYVDADDRGPFLLRAGEWTLTLDPSEDRAPVYAFQLWTAKQESVAISLDQELSPQLSSPGDRITWELTLPDPQRVYFDVVVGGKGMRWDATTPTGQRLFYDVDASHPNNGDRGPWTLAAGTYTVTLRAFGGAMPSPVLRVAAVDDVALDIEMNEVVEGGISTSGGTARYVFTPGQGQLVQADLILGEYGTRWRMVDPVGTDVFADKQATNPGLDEGPFRLAAGDYSLIFDADWSLTPAHTVRVIGEESTDGEVHYTRFAGTPNVRKVSYSYSGNEDFTTKIIETIATVNGADGIVFTPDGDVIIGGGSLVHRIDLETGEVESRKAVGLASYHLALDPSGNRVWSGGNSGLLGEIPLKPFSDVIIRPLTGDDNQLTSIAFDRQGSGYYTRSGSGGHGSFGLIDFKTFTTTRIHQNLDAAHGMVFDPYTDTLVMCGDSHVTQIDPKTLEIIGNLLVPGMTMDQGGTDGRGYGLFASNTGHLVFVDYAASGNIGDPTFVTAPYLEGALDDAAPLAWLGGACQTPLPPVDLSPADGATLPPGTTVTLSGQALAHDPTRPISAVLVDGMPVASLDGAGHIFHPIHVEPGTNLLSIEVIDRCGSLVVPYLLEGADPLDAGEQAFEDASATLQARYRRTTFHTPGPQRLIVDVRAVNTSENRQIDGPVLMVLGPGLHPAIELQSADGETESGDPYVVVVPEGETLPPGGQALAPVRMAFADSERRHVRFDAQFLAPKNNSPVFVTVPVVAAAPGAPYVYGAQAMDVDGHLLIWSLPIAPLGMTLDPDSGELSWAPGDADLGLHQVRLVVEDGHGGSALQSFDVLVAFAAGNGPPLFVTAPVTHASIGAEWSYAAQAQDPDGDAVAYELVAGPAGMSVDPESGLATWALALPGTFPVELHATDGNGGAAVQQWTLTVGKTPADAGAPVLTSTPATAAAVDLLYLYQPVASDPDGDALYFTLEEAPAGMTIDPATGRVLWTPSIDQVGAHTVALRVADALQAATVQTWTLVVSSTPPNLPPYFASVPAQDAMVGVGWTYDVLALDPEGSAVEYTLAAGPPPMTLDGATLSWIPVAADVGAATVALKALDLEDAAAHQVFVIDVRLTNADPQIVSTPPTGAAVGQKYAYAVAAKDIDGDALHFALMGGAAGPPPAGMSIDPVIGLLTWTPAVADAGSHAATVQVKDCCGGVATQTWSIAVILDDSPPVVAIETAKPKGCLLQPFAVCVDAADDVGVVARTLARDGQEIALQGDGCAPFLLEEPVVLALTATASDASGNVGEAARTLEVEDCTDPEKPAVELHGPEAGTTLFAPSEIVATISDNKPENLTWTVSIARDGTDDFTVIGAGTGPVDEAVVATLDPTLLANDTYRVQIVGDDGQQTGGIEFRYGVGGDFKLGNFRVTLTDALFTVAGIPLVLTRTYDSLDTAVSDFGAGWRFGLSASVSDDAVESTGDGLIGLLGGEAMSAKSRVYVTKPDGRRVGFRFDPENLGYPTMVQAKVRFTADPGVRDKLEPNGGQTKLFNLGGKYYDFIIPYNPDEYILTTEEGLKYTISETDGLLAVVDVAGNTLEVTPDGVFSSTGVAVLFERDDAGRIVTIEEPAIEGDPDDPSVLQYVYDGAGNLTMTVDQGGNETQYFYEQAGYPHYLTGWEDPLGRPVTRNVYGDEGRLVAQCGADGDIETLEGCATFEHDAVAGVETVVGARGFRTDRFYDDYGNLVSERRWLDDETFLETGATYDENNRPLVVLDAAGGEWTFEWDAAGRRTSQVDAAGRVFQATYGAACDEPLTETDAAGNVVTYTYDAKCRLVGAVDPLGGEVSMIYNESGQMTELVDPEGQSMVIHYDGIGRPTGHTDTLGRTTTRIVNTHAELLQTVDPDGRKVDFEYDAQHQLTKATWNTDPPRVESFKYNVGGEMIEAVAPDSVTTVTHTATGQIETVSNAGTTGVVEVVVSYTWDANGNVTSVADTLGGLTTYAYDGLDRLVRIEQSAEGGSERRVDLEYGVHSGPLKVTRYADLAASQAVVVTGYEYDAVGLVTAIRHQRPDGTPIHELEYTRDALGNVVSVVDLEGTTTFQYDGLRRLIAADRPEGGVLPDETYAYDAAGNRTASHMSGEYTYSKDLGEGGHELRQDGEFDYAFDDTGSVQAITSLDTGATVELTHDHRGRAKSMLVHDGVGGLVRSVTWVYDVGDRRVAAIEPGGTTTYVYDRAHPIVKVAPDGTITRRLYGPGIDVVLAEEVAGGGTRWFLTDLVGTPRDLVLDDGTIDAHFVFDSFGQLLDGSPETELLFGGREAMADVPLLYFRARLYSPRLGRFLQTDPVAPFRYDFADNNTLFYRDPLGQATAIENAIMKAKVALRLLWAKRWCVGTIVVVGGGATAVIFTSNVFTGLTGATVGALFETLSRFLKGTDLISDATGKFKQGIIDKAKTIIKVACK